MIKIKPIPFSLIFSFILFLGVLKDICSAKHDSYDSGPFKGNIQIELSDSKYQTGFQLALNEGILKLVYQSKSGKEEADVRKHCFKPAVGEIFQKKFEEYINRKNKIISILEQNLNKNNFRELQEVVNKDFELIKTFKLDTPFVDIRSQQDGTILRNVDPSLFHPNSQFTSAVYCFSHPFLIDLNKMAIYPLPADFRALIGEACQDPVAWSDDGKYFVLKKRIDFIWDESTKGEINYFVKNKLIAMDVTQKNIIFSTEIKGIISVAWSPDLKSLAVISYSYHVHTFWPWQWLLMRFKANHYTYYLELFHIEKGTRREFVLCHDKKLWGLCDIIWTE